MTTGRAAPTGFIGFADARVDLFLVRWASLSGRLAAESGVRPHPFQQVGWLASWYRTIGARPGVEPVCVTVTRADGEPVLLLPLSGERRGGLRIVRHADDGVTDYNTPLVGTTAPGETTALWAAVRRALRGTDLLQLDKMPRPAGGATNPLTALLPSRPCAEFGNEIVLPDDWDAWRRTLDKTVRKEFERTWRVFRREPDAAFERATTPATATAWFDALERLQRARMAPAGAAYRLDRPGWRAFYLDRLDRGLADGSVVLTALVCRGEPVAVLYGICDGERYVALRIGQAGDAWKHCGPGKLLLERTMHHLHGSGLRRIDLALGDYHHKRVFRATPLALVEARVALSLRGLPAVWAWQARHALKRRPWVVGLARAAARRPGLRPVHAFPIAGVPAGGAATLFDRSAG